MSAIKKKVLSESEVDKLLIAIDNMNEKNPQVFKTGWLDAGAEPKNVIERYVLKAMESLGHTDAGGYEWWIHDSGDGEGNNAHYDKNEEIWEKEGIIVSPVKGTVTYLSSSGQPTNIVDIKPKTNSHTDIKEECSFFIWSYPSEGNIMEFDGKLLHGVPPGNPNDDRITLMINVWESKEACGFIPAYDYEDDVDITLLDNEIRQPTRSEANVLYHPGAFYMGDNKQNPYAYQLLFPQLRDVSKEEDFFIARRTQKVYLALSEEEFKNNLKEFKDD